MGKEESLAVGGQAVMEGVMMRNKDLISIAVRKPDGKIKTKQQRYTGLGQRYKILGLPFIRGMVNLVEIMVIGTRALNWSSNQAMDEGEEFKTWELILSLVLAVAFALGLFKLLPLLAATAVNNTAGTTNIAFNLIDGGVKVLVLVGYLWAISRFKDVQRLFQYHGAEHKSINCHESGLKVTVKNVLASSRLHPRCGTTFILLVFLVSILFYLLIPLSTTFWAKLGLRILFLPLISGLTYEVIKLAGKHYDNPLAKAVTSPGLLLQRLTTKEPDAKQAAVAIKSLKNALKA
ncbi:MAG: DUF1385 domain-containing protein [Candidatus Woesearchaeota archaeon]